MGRRRRGANTGGAGHRGAAEVAVGQCPHLRSSVQLQNLRKVIQASTKSDFLQCLVREAMPMVVWCGGEGWLDMSGDAVARGTA